MVEGGGSTSSWKANGMDIHWDYVEPSMEIYEMTSCKQVLSIYRSILKMSLYLTMFVCLCTYVCVHCVCRSPAGMIEGTPQLHANAWKVSSACVAPVNLPIIDPCEMNQHNGNNDLICSHIILEVGLPVIYFFNLMENGKGEGWHEIYQAKECT